MTYFTDLPAYAYLSRLERESEVNIGWLDRTHESQRGNVPEDVLNRMFALHGHDLVIKNPACDCDRPVSQFGSRAHPALKSSRPLSEHGGKT